eukprot:XP_011673434.1 PREDICTED: C-type lectin domain family 4 member F-like [Strongylocentrotus purpuratus]
MKFASDETLFVAFIIAAIVSLQGVTSQQEWHLLDDAVYLVDNTTLEGWDEAQARCRGYGANLARVDSDEIQAFLTTFITPPLNVPRSFWIVGNDKEEEGQFRWLDGTPVNSTPEGNVYATDKCCATPTTALVMALSRLFFSFINPTLCLAASHLRRMRLARPRRVLPAAAFLLNMDRSRF